MLIVTNHIASLNVKQVIKIPARNHKKNTCKASGKRDCFLSKKSTIDFATKINAFAC